MCRRRVFIFVLNLSVDMGIIFNEEAAAVLLPQGNMEAFDFYYHRYHQPVYANILKIRPPLIFSRDNADLLVESLRDTLAKA